MYSWELQEFIDVGDQVVVVLLVKAMGRGSNVAVERQDAMACQMRERRIARIDYYNSREQALRAVGLEE